ncbi:MAG: ornithine carbamoyltransferase, partial [Deltaproteobacteria bacterium]
LFLSKGEVCLAAYGPQPSIVARAAAQGTAQVVHNAAGVEGADVVYTDVWTSMGQEAEQEARRRAFAGLQIGTARMRRAKPHAIFLPCLPAYRGEEVAAEVIDGHQSRVLLQAENRLHVQKALLAFLSLGRFV